MEKSKEARSKADAIRLFLERYQPKLPEARGFLQFLLAKEEILRRLELVSDPDDYPNAIFISAKGARGWPFYYRCGERTVFKTSQAVVELMKSIPQPLYLCLETAPPEWSPERQEFLEMLARWREEIFMDEVARLNRRHDILSHIDAALEQGDQDGFLRWSRELRRLESSWH